jgi:peptidoglycan LD-endopeptidase LytH
MVRLVVLAALVSTAWLAREARWFPLPLALPPAAPHDAYRRSLEHSGIAATELGRAWLDASARAVATATPTSLPVRRSTRVDASRPTAFGFRVTLKRGQRVDVTTSVATPTPAQTFVDIFEPRDDEPSHESGALRSIDYEMDEDGEVIVRVQPELLRSGNLDVSIRAAPALRFPVADVRVPAVQSVFGDPRDAGRRRHEGVDIFAKRGTHVLAASDGIVTRVGENALGGRVVWVLDPSRGLMLYYAHLDEQLVAAGQRVDAGDVLGTVGNTGNARTTAPHLHFGIYERGIGAIDPYWFVAPVSARTSAMR